MTIVPNSGPGSQSGINSDNADELTSRYMLRGQEQESAR
jgi:hypothetical protein